MLNHKIHHDIHIAIIMYLIIPVVNFIAEKAFSKLIRVKNNKRSLFMYSIIFNILSTENDVQQNINFE